jgi:hypothetical protein
MDSFKLQQLPFKENSLSYPLEWSLKRPEIQFWRGREVKQPILQPEIKSWSFIS